MALKGHFDGRVVVLDETPPAEWQPNQAVLVTPVAAHTHGAEEGPCNVFLKIAARARDLGLPPDFSERHDHYMHGAPR